MLIKPISFWQGPVVVGTTPTAQQFIYLNGYNFYQWKDTRLGLVGIGGLAKIDLTGSLDTTWCTNANPSVQTEVRFTTALNGYIYGDTRNSVGGNQIKKWDAATGNIVATAAVGNATWAMSAREGNTFFIITGTKTNTFAGGATNGVGKINENMTRDTTFNTNLGTAGGGASTFVERSFVSADRIGVVGQFTTWNGNAAYDRFVVLNYDGTRDTGFVRTGAFNGNVNTVIFIDNKWIVGGAFTTYGGVTQNKIMAFNTDGTVNTTFTTNIGTGFNSDVSNITRVSDTQILVTGVFTQLNGVNRGRIALLNTDGTIPTNPFGTGFTTSSPRFIGLDNTGKYYIAGAPVITQYQSTKYQSRNFFALNSDGSVNESFATGSAMRTSAATPATAEAGGLFVF